jgi:osomolarity two-component system sensor histidine kinase CHK1
VLKLCTVNHLDTLARLRLEWKMLSDVSTSSSKVTSLHSATTSSTPDSEHYGGSTSSSFSAATLASNPNVIRPFAWDYLPEGGLTLVYLNEPFHMTLEEAFIVSSSSTPPRDPQAPPTAKPRTQSDLIRILSVFSEVVAVLGCAHKSGVTHNNSMFIGSIGGCVDSPSWGSREANCV